MTGTLTNIYRAGLLCSLLLISNIAETSSMTLGPTELRNKVSKIKVNQRGKLWASGHFMGKKSIVDGSLMESGLEDVNVPAEFKAVLLSVKDLQSRLTHKLETAQQIPVGAPLDITWEMGDNNFVLKCIHCCSCNDYC